MEIGSPILQSITRLPNSVQQISFAHFDERVDRLLPRRADVPHGHSRIDLLSQAFPDALFVHVVRDGRAVSESIARMLRTSAAWAGRWGARRAWAERWPSRHRERALRAIDDPFVFAALFWASCVRGCRVEGARVGASRYLEIAYEDLARRTLPTLERVLAFADLRRSSRVEEGLRVVPPTDNVAKWKTALTEANLVAFDALLDGDVRGLVRDGGADGSC